MAKLKMESGNTYDCGPQGDASSKDDVEVLSGKVSEAKKNGTFVKCGDAAVNPDKVEAVVEIRTPDDGNDDNMSRPSTNSVTVNFN